MTDRSGRFSKYPATSMVSIFKNTHEKVMIHLLHDSTLSESNRQKFIELVLRYNQSIQFYNVDEIFPDRIKNLKRKHDEIPKLGDWTFGAMYRLLAPELIDLPKIIYFDTDIIANLDIEEIWSIDLKNYPIAAKSEADVFPDIKEIPPEIDLFNSNPKKICDEFQFVKRENYFGSAVLILNLDLIRRIFSEENTTLIDSSLEILKKFPFEYPDQDALNFLFSESYLHLPAKYNIFVWQINNYLRMNKQPLRIDRWVYHFSGYNQKFDSEHEFSRLWFNYFCKTPFCDEETFFNLAKNFKSQLDEERLKMQRLFDLLKRKHVAAFIFEKSLPRIKNFQFEEFILADESLQKSIQNLFDFLQRDSHKNFVMIFISEFRRISEILEQFGFIKDEDFCDGLQFLTRESGGNFREDRWIVFDM